MKIHHSLLFALVLLGAISPQSSRAETNTFRLGAPFADHAVLQRDMPVPIWGWSKPGATVTIQFAEQVKTAIADKEGAWKIELDALEASFKPRELAIKCSTGDQKTLKNLLVGEVWLASGQSNMQWAASKSSARNLKVTQVNGVNPIREFEVKSVYAMLHPIRKAEGEWKDGSYMQYSAIAFAFAHKLYGELKVPIGILNCSFSQTAIQAWVPREGFKDAKDAYTQAIYKKILETNPSTPAHKAAWDKFYQGIEDTLKNNQELVKSGHFAKAVDTKTPGNMRGNRDASWLFNGRLSPVVPYAIRGCIWNQGYANMGEGLPYYYNLHSLVRGWRLVFSRPQLPVYFHQFYCPNQKEWKNHPTISSQAEMRLGTWLARDIPGTGMASQIDITGGIHYYSKTIPGQRLALHALKNQYGKKITSDGPMFKSYKVKGDKLIVEFDYAESGLVVASTAYNTNRKNKGATGFADPKLIENGESQVRLFYLADEKRIWHPAEVKIDGEKVILSSSAVKSPKGVSYATGGVGPQPNLYNKALLPMTPFIHFDQKLVTRDTWPDEKLKVAGVTVNPATVGKLAEWTKMPLLSTQFRDNAVLQADTPITFWGSILHDWGYEAKGKAEIRFSFNGIEKSIQVRDDAPEIFDMGPNHSRGSTCKEWRITVPAMKASSEPRTLKVTFLIDGEIAHQRVCENIVIGDVWFIAAPPGKFKNKNKGAANPLVRMLKRQAKRDRSSKPSRYSVAVSRTPKNRFASKWIEPTGLAADLGNRIAEKTGRPVGIIFMQSLTKKVKGQPPEDLTFLKSWIPAADLKLAPSLKDDYRALAARFPESQYYRDSVDAYIGKWKKYWSEYIPEMMRTGAVPDGVSWGSYPTLKSEATSHASQVYNVLVHSFTPAKLKGIIFLTSPVMYEKDKGASFAEQMSVLANSWKNRFGGPDRNDSHDPIFFYTMPAKSRAPSASHPSQIQGKSVSYETDVNMDVSALVNAVTKATYRNLIGP